MANKPNQDQSFLDETNSQLIRPQPSNSGTGCPQCDAIRNPPKPCPHKRPAGGGDSSSKDSQNEAAEQDKSAADHAKTQSQQPTAELLFANPEDKDDFTQENN